MVLLHGGNLDRRMWDEQFLLVSRRYHVIGVARAWLGSAYVRTAMEKPTLAPRVRQLVLDQASYWMGLVRHQDVEREAAPPAAERLEELRVPVLLLVGDRDTPFIADVARAIVARAPRVRRVDIPQAGHMLNLEASDRFNDEVLRFLGSKCPPKVACD